MKPEEGDREVRTVHVQTREQESSAARHIEFQECAYNDSV